MKIVLIGQAAFGEKVLRALIQRGEEIVGVYLPPDIPGKSNTFKELAQQSGIPCFQPRSMRAPDVYSEYIKLKPDLNVMAYVTDIIPENILIYPRLKTIQYHPSLLPRHRGASSINWAIIQGETKTGLTIFWPDRGLDTGPILLQKEVDIAPDDTVGSIYFNKLFPLGVAALVESIELIKNGKAPRIPQDESKATYEGICTEKDAFINWDQPAFRVYNLIRGTNPQPGANTVFKNERFKIFDSELVKGYQSGLPGVVVEINSRGIIVACRDGGILIIKMQPVGQGKIASLDFAAHMHLAAGDRLG
jgi:methionyl-tRNA formyltransferase